jgi:fibronectin-binding autotransporter adhesin
MTVVGDGTNPATLQAGAANAFSPNSAVNVLANSALDLAGFSQQIVALDGTGTGAVTNKAFSTTATLTLLGDRGTDTLASSASIVDKTTTGNAGFGTLNLVKSGGYTQVLSGMNTYGGTTTISMGTLAAGSASH